MVSEARWVRNSFTSCCVSTCFAISALLPFCNIVPHSNQPGVLWNIIIDTSSANDPRCIRFFAWIISIPECNKVIEEDTDSAKWTSQIVESIDEETSRRCNATLNMTTSFMNHVLWSLGDHENLTTFLADSTKYDIVVILVFFSELFDKYPIRGSVRKVFFRFLVGTACSQYCWHCHAVQGSGCWANA